MPNPKRLVCPHCGGRVHNEQDEDLFYHCVDCQTMFAGPPPIKDSIVKPTFRFVRPRTLPQSEAAKDLARDIDKDLHSCNPDET